MPYLYPNHQCPARFANVDDMRAHGIQFHKSLPPHDPVCTCASEQHARFPPCRVVRCAWYLSLLRNAKIAEIDWRPGHNYEPTQYYSQPHLPWWVALIWNFIYVRRASGDPPKWWWKASNCGLLAYMNELARLSVEAALCRPVEMSFIEHDHTATIAFPWLEDESTPVASASSGDLHKKTWATTSQLTTKVVNALSIGHGLDCIVSHGLDGFACSFPRIRQFILNLASPVAFMIILKDDNGLKNEGRGFIDGKMLDGGRFILVHQDELLADPPSQKTQLLLDAWFEIQNTKRDENGNTRLSKRNST
jgi:hypothetical protein